MSDRIILHISRFRGEIFYRGIPSHFFIRRGHLSLCHISQLFISAALDPVDYGFINGREYFDGRRRLITVRTLLNLLPPIHKIADHDRLNAISVTTMHAMGKTSIVLKTTIMADVTKEIWGNFFFKLVLVDWETKKPTEFPDDFVKPNLKNSGVLHQLSGKMEIEEVPNNAFKSRSLPRFSDYDKNYHLTTHSYFDYLINCASEAAVSGYYKNFVHDMSWYPVKDVDIVFLGEIRTRECIIIYTWQDKMDLRKIYFSIFFKDKCILKAWILFNHAMSNSITANL